MRKSRRQSSKKRGGTRKIRFQNENTFSTINENELFSTKENGNRYLSNLRNRLYKRIYVPSQYHARDAEILANVMEFNETLPEMIDALKRIYKPERLLPSEFDSIQRILGSLPPKNAINKLNDPYETVDIPYELKRKILGNLRYNQAVRKLQHTFTNKNISVVPLTPAP